jgi:hypothetical protein
MDFRALAQRLLVSSETLVPQWLPGGRRRGHEWVCGDLAGGEGTSLSVNLLSGRWADFATSDRGGDLIDLYAAIHELTMAEAYRELDGTSTAAAPSRPAKPAKPPRTVVTPVPEAAADCECVHPLYGAPSACWTYWDGNGEVLGYVARYDPPGQRKQIVPWTWDGAQWGMGQWPVPRPLYRLQELEARSADPVLIVEGEKAADAAAAISGPYVVCTWPGGGQAVNRANWKPVHGRKVLLWPDADEPGIQTMQRLAAMLAPHCIEVKIIDPTGMPDGWDAADSGFTSWAEARAWIAPRTSVYTQQPEPEPPKPAGPEPQPRPEPQSAEHAEAQAAADERDPSSLMPAEWHKRFAYVVPDDAYFDLAQKQEYSRAAFNAAFRHVRCHSVHLNADGKAKRIEAATSYDENRVAMGGRMLAGITYAPGRNVLCEHTGQVFGNKWRDARPAVSGGDPGPWLEHVQRLIPDDAERRHFLDALAFKVQNPGVKINHALLIGGAQGAGKDSMIAPLLYAIGGENKTNCTSVETTELTQPWGYFLENEVIIFNELRQTEAIDRRALENRLKPILAAPPELLTVQRKGAHPVQVLNQALVLAMTNFRDAIAIPTEDRRWFVLWTDAPRMAEADAAALWRYFRAGGLQAGAAYLRARDVSAFSPGATPPWTEAKSIMVSQARSLSESWLIERIQRRSEEFRAPVVCGPWSRLVERLQEQAPPQVRITIQSLTLALAEAGWSDFGMCKSRAHQTAAHCFAAPEFTGTKSEARDAAVSASVHGAVVREFRRVVPD